MEYRCYHCDFQTDSPRTAEDHVRMTGHRDPIDRAPLSLGGLGVPGVRAPQPSAPLATLGLAQVNLEQRLRQTWFPAPIAGPVEIVTCPVCVALVIDWPRHRDWHLAAGH